MPVSVNDNKNSAIFYQFAVRSYAHEPVTRKSLQTKPNFPPPIRAHSENYKKTSAFL